MFKSKLNFRMISPQHVQIVRDDKVIGAFWMDEEPFPFLTDKDMTNSIQICGFDKRSEEWSCGRFGHNDMVIHFNPKKICKECGREIAD